MERESRIFFTLIILVYFAGFLDCTEASCDLHVDKDAHVSVYDILDKDDDINDAGEKVADKIQGVENQLDSDTGDVDTKATEEQGSNGKQNYREIPGPVDVEEEKNAVEEKKDIKQVTQDNIQMLKQDEY